jgi:protein ImuB
VVVDRVSAGKRVACVWVPFFAAAAAERCESALVERPLAIVRGMPPATGVVEANAAARERGVAPGLTETEARARCSGLVTREFSEEQVASARHALLEAALAVSPRIEDAGPGLVYVDIAGLGRLIGDEAAIGERLVRHARAVGLRARLGIAGSRTAARVTARQATARIVAVPAGGERGALAAAPLAVLDLPAQLETTLARWGVTTLGELAALPRAGLAERLGPAGLRAHDLALGRDTDPFRPYLPPPFWEETQGLDWEIDDLGALVAVLGRTLEQLCARLTAAHVWADRLDVQLQLATGARHERTIALAQPTCEVALMLALIRFELVAHPPPASVTGVVLSARVVLGQAGQGGLWQPPAPRQRDLAALVARLAELVGGDNFGSPELVDSHRPDAVALIPFSPPDENADGRGSSGGGAAVSDPWGSVVEDGRPAPGTHSQLMLRRLRPAPRVEVVTDGEWPLRVRRRDVAMRVVAGAGPWRVSGEWWDAHGWARDEWDLLLHDGTLCRLAHDRVTGAWMLDGIYD